jgi:hypothetical protein
MKKQLFLSFLLGFFSLALKAQDSNPAAQTPPLPPPPPAPAPAAPGLHGERGPMANLSEAERAQVKVAHDKAIQQNPALDQKMKAAHQAMEDAKKAMHDAMVAVDPTVEPILAKMMPPKWPGKHDGAPATQVTQNGASPSATNASAGIRPWQQPGHHEPAGMANLTESERQQLKSLHERVKNDPSVLAAKEAKQNATTPEARHTAEESLHQAMHDAMIKADPSIEPILTKLHPDANGGGAPGQSAPSPSAAPMVQ